MGSTGSAGSPQTGSPLADAAGNLIKVFYDNGAALEIGYDNYMRQTSVADGVLKIGMGDDTYGFLRSKHRWQRDGYGRVIEEVSPKGYTTQYAYDAHGRRQCGVRRQSEAATALWLGLRCDV